MVGAGKRGRNKCAFQPHETHPTHAFHKRQESQEPANPRRKIKTTERNPGTNKNTTKNRSHPTRIFVLPAYTANIQHRTNERHLSPTLESFGLPRIQRCQHRLCVVPRQPSWTVETAAPHQLSTTHVVPAANFSENVESVTNLPGCCHLDPGKSPDLGHLR